MAKALFAILIALVQFPAFADGALPRGVYALSGIDENLTYQDLEPLEKMIGTSRVVGLGESIHTSGGYLQAKYRLIKFLVEKMGFRGVLMETPLRDALATSQYIADCSGGIEKAMNGIFDVFASKSTEDLFRFLCEFNRNHPKDPVRFFGFDIQETYNNLPLVRGYLNKVAQANAESLLKGSDHCIGARATSPAEFKSDPTVQDAYNGTNPPAQDLHDQCQLSLTRVSKFMDEHKAELIQRSSESQFFYAEIAVGSVAAFENVLFFMNNNFSAALESRDAGMAGVVKELLRFEMPKSKVIVWAQNSHLSMAGDKIVYPNQPGYAPRYMGWWLNHWLGQTYFPIALIGYNVEINWTDTQKPPPQPPAGSVEDILHGLKQDYLLLGSQNALLKSNTYYPMEQLEEIPFQQYKALLYFERSPGMIYWDQ